VGAANRPSAPPAPASGATATSRSERASTSSPVSPIRWLPNRGPLGVAPRVGLRPTSPQQAAGTRIEPAASVAWAIATMPAATAAPAPPEDPPGEREGSQGLRAPGPPGGSLVRQRPNSGTVVRPNGSSPAPRKRANRSLSATSAAVRAATARQPPVTLSPLAWLPRSLARNGTPPNGALSPAG